MKVSDANCFVDLVKVQYPQIAPVPAGINQPLWSVMIPVYNGEKYLEQTLRSVLDQDLGVGQMQIEVIDDCSVDDSEILVKEIGQGRISFFRQSRNVGLIENWNSCIQRSRGQWIHILHQDDIVLPGFYRRLQVATEMKGSIGAAFCRHALIDEDSHWFALSSLERRAAGVLANWVEKIAVAQQIQFPSIVVKRDTYEQLGGFCAEAHYASDWEMWKRISAHYSVWYEPQILACYRLHSASETSRVIQSGSDVVDMRKAIEISRSYLPASTVDELTRQAKELSALRALKTAKQMVSRKDFTAAMAQLREAFLCSRSSKVLRSTLPLFKALGAHYVKNKFTRGTRL